jgi:predicted PolB exonuclease-like 3'-5' exonuclease
MRPTKESLFYFDCEWVPVTDAYFNLRMDHPLIADAFDHQMDKWKEKELEDGKKIEGKDADYWWDKKAHFYPEFCKIVCVSYGYYKKGGETEIKSVYGDDEKKLLSTVADLFGKVDKSSLYLCGAAIQRYDMPWLSKRMMSNNIVPPSNLNVYGKKPWDIEIYDIMQVWGQGNLQESYTPMELIAASLNIVSSKNDLSGSKVSEAYFNGELDRIKTYCEEDVKCTINIAEKLIQLSL